MIIKEIALSGPQLEFLSPGVRECLPKFTLTINWSKRKIILAKKQKISRDQFYSLKKFNRYINKQALIKRLHGSAYHVLLVFDPLDFCFLFNKILNQIGDGCLGAKSIIQKTKESPDSLIKDILPFRLETVYFKEASRHQMTYILSCPLK